MTDPVLKIVTPYQKEDVMVTNTSASFKAFMLLLIIVILPGGTILFLNFSTG